MGPGKVNGVIRLLKSVADEFGISDAFLVGGYPRTLAMGLPLSDVHDIDVATGTPQKATQLAGFVSAASAGHAYKIRHRSMTVTLDVNGVEVDFQGPASHDDVVPYIHLMGIEPTPIARNVFDRDFTINSLAMPLGGDEVLDLTRRGLPDIEDGRIASILPPDVSVPRDPLMVTRAVRFAKRYGFRIDGLLWAAMKDNAGELGKKISPQRLAIEAFLLSRLDAGDMLEELGLGDMMSPEVVSIGAGGADK